MKASDIREKSHQEILEGLEDSKRELLNYRFQWQAGEIRNSAQYKEIKKDIARLKTVLREVELGINTDLTEMKKD
ncbi:MAG: 50S ribosomal protein L29 [Candidatus Scalindua sp.]|nr:50S ribosomal protein L29 [Candidatus Scalindua sp.]MBT5305812.1 50S ribosomal protein L29 [Candidatus Scalindua sp.]MBT6050964.1 50S ribosomal protein L29 [Candidatus Scalindua sp.]MBT6231641.1 50S ribosomal protein L29 [Candidatus Scalindua sp.]MBT6561353.1 50S ribosomal protein L29 [Candidatus Scalindua sp.]